MAYVFQTKGKSGKIHPRWRFQYTDRHGNRRTATGTTSKTETQKLALKKQSDEHCIRKGLMPAPVSSAKKVLRPFPEILREYINWGKSQGGRGGMPWGKNHARMRNEHLEWWQEELSLQKLADIQECLTHVEKALQKLQKAGRSGKTLNNYAESLKSFCNWCIPRGYLSTNPLESLKKFNCAPKTTRRRFTEDELRRLLNSAPDYRSLLYSVALSSGLRAGELRSLAPADLDTEKNGLVLHAEWTKNRKAGFQPLPPEIVQQLKAFAEQGTAKRLYKRYGATQNVRCQTPEKPLLFLPNDPAGTLDRDLVAARIKKTTPEGKVDFHALRVAFVSLTIEAGATAKEAQELARHSTVDLTMNVYGRVNKNHLAQVVNGIGASIFSKGNTTGAQLAEGAIANQGRANTKMVPGAGLEPAIQLRN